MLRVRGEGTKGQRCVATRALLLLGATGKLGATGLAVDLSSGREIEGIGYSKEI